MIFIMAVIICLDCQSLNAVDGVNYPGVQHLAGLVHHSQLAACPVTGVNPQNNPAAQRRLQQQVAEVQGKHLDGVLARPVGDFAPYFPFNRRENQPVISVRGGCPHCFGTGRAFPDMGRARDTDAPFPVKGNLHLRNSSRSPRLIAST